MGRLSAALLGDYQFDGSTYEPRDQARLSGQLRNVFLAMSDHRWWTLAELSIRAGGTEASVSARIRDLRKQRFGGHVIDRRRSDDGLFEYRMLPDGL